MKKALISKIFLRTLWLSACLGLAACSAATATTPSKMSEVKNEGTMAKDFLLKDTNGKEYSLSQFKGKKVYLKFWTSWCSICLSGLEDLNTLAGEEKDFAVISVVTPGQNGEKSSEDFSRWFNGLGYDKVTVLLDEQGELRKEYAVRAYPASAYIGSDGIITKVLPGHTANDTIKAEFQKIQ